MDRAENRRKTGSNYEKRAAEYLSSLGYEILEMNYRCRSGEIDIVALDGNYLVFVEVKYRTDTYAGFPEEAVTAKKQRTISRVAAYYCLSHGLTDRSCRFDVVAFLGEEVRLIRNAFDYQL